jgi:hypothetical protein
MLTVNRNTSKKKQENRPPASPLLQKVNVLGTEMKIIGANETVKEVFNITGFSGIMIIN